MELISWQLRYHSINQLNKTMNNREKRKKIAEDTLKIIEAGEYNTIDNQIIDISETQRLAEIDTIVYSPDMSDELIKKQENRVIIFNTEIEVNDSTTLDAVRDLIGAGYENVLCLNFASARNAGGGFLGGSQAQEESIARSTGLYNCQLKSESYYQTNRKVKSCFYTDYMIYSPKVPIFKDEEGNNLSKLTTCSIITAPAVNTGVVKHREPERMIEVEEVMKRRINKILAIAEYHKHETIVLGAWGCGVFLNNPIDIAAYFKEVISTHYAGVFKKIVFAIYSSNKKFILPFQENFEH